MEVKATFLLTKINTLTAQNKLILRLHKLHALSCALKAVL